MKYENILTKGEYLTLQDFAYDKGISFYQSCELFLACQKDWEVLGRIVDYATSLGCISYADVKIFLIKKILRTLVKKYLN